MVVRKVMRWSPWAPAAAEGKRKYRVKVAVVRVDGFSPGSAAVDDGEGPRVVSVEIRWKGPPGGRGLSYLRGRRKPTRCVSAERPVRGGSVEWGEEEGAGFEHVCGFAVAERAGSFGAWNVSLHLLSIDRTYINRAGSFGAWNVSLHLLSIDRTYINRAGSFGAWNVSLHLLSVKGDQGEKKHQEIGTAMLNLGDLASQLNGGEEKESSEHSQILRELPITSRAGCPDTKLSVSITFVEMRSTQELSEPTLQEAAGDERNRKAAAHEKQTTEYSSSFDSDASEETRQQLQTFQATATSEEDMGACSCSSTDAEGGNSAAGWPSPPKRGLFSWRKRRRKSSGSDGGEGSEGAGSSVPSNGSTSPDDKVREQGTLVSVLDVPGDLTTAGSWEEEELISRDGQTKLKASTFFASIDQRDESAGGESACTALVVVIADALQSNQMNTPTRSQFDALIREGSSAWRNLCGLHFYTDRFPDKHFDLDTVLEARLRPVSVSPEKSYVGFFQPESFESLRGAMSFDDMWNEIARGVEEGGTKVYIVSWNDHFFLLKVEADAFYVIDTLGERLFEGCDKAYILRFDSSASVYRLPEEEGHEQELICSGKDCCREFINRFLAAIPLREELEAEEKRGEGPGVNALHQRLQVEFHLVQASVEAQAKE